jgi:mRNA-degrading endonuclease toxin of MazEF toxin-antitoxin module
LKSPRAWQPWPEAGDIVECRFPHEVGVPGPKERPALVLQVEENDDDPSCCVVVVAYATSQKIDQVYAGEFVLPGSAINGLPKTTKFDLVNRHALLFNDVWFAPAAKTRPHHPKRGRLDLNDLTLKRKLQATINEAARLRPRSL